MKQRYIKVQPHIYEHRRIVFGELQSSTVPKLVLCGKWLQDAGIQPGQHVTITPENGKLIISA